jgi:hypothetical protein
VHKAMNRMTKRKFHRHQGSRCLHLHVESWRDVKQARSVCHLSMFQILNCPMANKIVKALAPERQITHSMKHWVGPLPKPRVSPPKTLGDAVIKNSHIRLRGGQMVPMLFKMSLPSTANTSFSSPVTIHTHQWNDVVQEWPSLPKIRLPRASPATVAKLSCELDSAQMVGFQN